MKCKDCNCCQKRHCVNGPPIYVCTGVKHPFEIKDINRECTEYPEDNASTYGSYERLMQNLNAAKWELKNKNDPSLNFCIRYIKDATLDVGRLNLELIKLQAIQEMRNKNTDLDVCDCWE